MFGKKISLVAAACIFPALVRAGLSPPSGGDCDGEPCPSDEVFNSFPEAHIHFLMDRSTSMVTFNEKCRKIEDAGGLITQGVDHGFDCWDLFANFIENTVLQIQKSTARNLPLKDGMGYYDWERKNLKVSVKGFGCKGNDAPVTMDYVHPTSNPAAFRRGMDKFRADGIPTQSGTCPGQGMEYIISDIEQARWANVFAKKPKGIFNIVIIVTDGVLDDNNRATNAAKAMRERGIITVAVSIAGAGNRSTNKRQREQLRQLAGPNKNHQHWLKSFVLYEVVENMPITFLAGVKVFEADTRGPVEPYCDYGHPDDLRSDEAKEYILRKYGNKAITNNVMYFRYACFLSWTHNKACTYDFEKNVCVPYVYDEDETNYCHRYDGKENKCNNKNPCYYEREENLCLPISEGVLCGGLERSACPGGLKASVRHQCQWDSVLKHCLASKDNIYYYL